MRKLDGLRVLQLQLARADSDQDLQLCGIRVDIQIKKPSSPFLPHGP